MNWYRIPFLFAVTFLILGNNRLVINQGWSMAAQFLAMLAIAMICILSLSRYGTQRFQQSLLYFTPVLVFYGYMMAAQVMMVGNFGRGLLSTLQYIGVSVLTVWMIPALLLISPKIRYWTLRVMLFSSVVLAIAGIVGSIVPAGLLGEVLSQKRSYGFGGIFHASGGILEHMITLSVQLMLALFILRWFRDSHAESRKSYLLMGIAVLSFGLLVTMGRSGWLGAASGLIMASLVRKSFVVTAFGVIGMAFVSGMMYLVVYEVAQEVDWLGGLLRLDHGLSNREYLWTVSIDLIKQNPLGWGYQAPQTELAHLFYGDFAEKQGIGGAGSHNTFLDICLSYGIPAVILYYGIFISAFINVIRSRLDLPMKRLLVASVLGVLLSSHFITFNIGGARFTTICINILIGMALLSPLITKRRYQEDSASRILRNVPER